MTCPSPPPLSPSLGLTPTNNRMSAIFPLLSPLFFVCSIEDALSEIWFQWPSQKVICTPNWLSSKCCANWTTLAPSQGSARASAVCSEKRGILFNPPSAKVRETSEHPVGSQLSCTTRWCKNHGAYPVFWPQSMVISRFVSISRKNTCKLVESRRLVAAILAILASVGSSTTHVVAFLDPTWRKRVG